MSLGLRLAVGGAHRTVAYVEREAFCCAVLAAQMEAGCLDPAPVHADLRSFPARSFRGRVDLVAAGIPCQPHSLAGLRRGTDDPRDLVSNLVDCVALCEPGAVFVENVVGFRKAGLPALLHGLAALGFDAEWDVFTAAASGAPHRRQRMFVLAAHADGRRLEEQRQPEPAGLESPPGHKPERRGAAERIGAGWWTAEPGVGRVADGTADRVDRIRALGNSVVPMVVARAWHTLWERMT